MRSRLLNRWMTAVGFLGGLILGGPSVSWGDEVIVAPAGGVVTVSVSVKGTPPPSRIFHMVFSPNIEFCTRVSDGKGNRLLKEFRVSEDGGVQDVVVAGGGGG